MTDKIDVRALAQLARLEVSDEELAKLEREIPDILKFVETIQAVSAPSFAKATARAQQGYDEPRTVSGKAPAPSPALKNVMREDASPHEGGLYTETLLKAAPSIVDNRIAVKQVIKRSK